MSENRPKVSCIIAVYNGDRYLREAIDSLLAQDYPNVEIVVVDDGSTDATPDVVEGYGDLLVALRQDNQGVSVARNRGVDAATGDLLCFLDADDLLDPRKIAMQVAAFEGEPTLDLCDCHTSYFWSPELAESQLRSDSRHGEEFWHDIIPGHISTWLFTRDLWTRIGTFEPGKRFAEDVDWYARGKDIGMCRRTLPDTLTARRLHPGNVTAGDRNAQRDDLTEALMAHLLRKRKGGGS